MSQAQRDPREKHPKPPFPEQEQPHPGRTSDMAPRPDHGERSYRGYGRLDDRVALVTGGDSGIGRAVCLAYAREGADVAIAYLTETEDAEETARLVREAEREPLLSPGDLSDAACCKRLVEATVKRFGRIDVLVNNAAYQGETIEGFDDFTPERVEHTFRTNVMAMFHLVREALPHMSPGSSIINVASVQAYSPSFEILDYASTKGAIVTFTKGLAKGLAPRGIRVNAVAPGAVWTPLIPQSFDAEETATKGGDNLMGRPGQPAELAPAFVFLASDEASFVTGEVLGVTGGVILP